MRLNSISVLSCLLAVACFSVAAQEFENMRLRLRNEVVCIVNTEKISKLDVEDRMGIIPAKIEAMRDNLEQAGQLTKENEAKLDEMYGEPFRDALRGAVRDKLMLISAQAEKVAVDEKDYQKRYQKMIERLRSEGNLGSKGLTPAEVQSRLHEQMTINAFRSRFYSVLDQPSRPEVQKYYQENIGKYQRKAGVKVRVIRVDRIVVNRLTGKTTPRENALEIAEEMRKDVVEYGADFKELARERSDDLESRKRGGLIQLDPNDPYIDPDAYNDQLAGALRGLKPGEVSKVFEFGKASWAFVLLEDRREAGPRPLEGELYEDIFDEMLKRKTRHEEDAWFRKALSNSLVAHVVEGQPKALPIEFFFPDDKKEAPSAPAGPRLNGGNTSR